MQLTGAGEGIPEGKRAFSDPENPARPLEELITSGVLWAINEEMFWIHGAALALHIDSEGKVCGWSLQNSPDGTRIDIPKELKDDRWARYRKTVREALGWGAGW